MMSNIGTARAADQLCEGCAMPASDVGPLGAYRVTFSHGVTHVLKWCEDCAAVAAYGVEHPGAAVGAGAAPTHITKVERVAVGQETTSTALARPRTMDDGDILSEFDSQNARVLEEAYPDAFALMFARPMGAAR